MRKVSSTTKKIVRHSFNEIRAMQELHWNYLVVNANRHPLTQINAEVIYVFSDKKSSENVNLPYQNNLEIIRRYLNDQEVKEGGKFKLSEKDFVYRLDIADVTEDLLGKVKVVAINDNGQDLREVRT